jgi:hypothetical protein
MKTSSWFVFLVYLHLAGFARAGSDYVAHEWGTFTSVQGADGLQMAWNPLSVSELPKFVYDASRSNGLASRKSVELLATKNAFQTLQRMETPVIYFYSERQQKLDVTVRFPQGMVTEWYPHITPWSPGRTVLNGGPNLIEWKDVQVFPRARHSELGSQLLNEPQGSHYYAARETEADFLQVGSPDPNGRKETEKFLFYRGVGNFQAPLTVVQTGDDADSLTLKNAGSNELHNLFVYVVRGNTAKFVSISELAPQATRQVPLASKGSFGPLSVTREQLAAEMEEALVNEGLYRPEAKAMLQTWNDSWFAESGVRVLYTLPRVWTDRILPLALEPKPREVSRVMVGRAELITPSMEWALLKQIVHYNEAPANERSAIIARTQDLGLGRFLEPTRRRLLNKFSHRELFQSSEELLRLAVQREPAGKALAAK